MYIATRRARLEAREAGFLVLHTYIALLHSHINCLILEIVHEIEVKIFALFSALIFSDGSLFLRHSR